MGISSCHMQQICLLSFKPPVKILHSKEFIMTFACVQKNDEELLQKAIIYEAEHGFPNSVGQTKRFNIC